MKIAIVGLGLIGGSLAKAIQKNTTHRVLGLDADPAVLKEALAAGAVDEAGDETLLSQADLVILGLYPDQVFDYVRTHAARFRSGAVVTDVSGIKTKVCRQMEKHGLGDFVFLGGHPMAGREVSGFANSSAELFERASYILTPLDAPDAAVEMMRQLALELGFGQVVVTTPEHHDQVIAYTSQIAHVLACAYVLSPRSREHQGFSAGSFRDVSRVAKINETLWTQLFLDNREPLAEELDTLIGHLAVMRDLIRQGQREELSDMLRQGREIKEALDQ